MILPSSAPKLPPQASRVASATTPGFLTRWHFFQLQQPGAIESDVLIPIVHGTNSAAARELEDIGIPRSVAEPMVDSLSRLCSAFSRWLGDIRLSLVSACSDFEVSGDRDSFVVRAGAEVTRPAVTTATVGRAPMSGYSITAAPQAPSPLEPGGTKVEVRLTFADRLKLPLSPDLIKAGIHFPSTLFDIRSVTTPADRASALSGSGDDPYPPNTDGAVELPLEVRLLCNAWHIDKLRALYSRGSSGDAEEQYFLPRAFSLLSRYETLSGNSSGMQGALSPEVFRFLNKHLGVTAEAFASPLNCFMPTYCSLFPDTDSFFGSRGDFFRLRPVSGAFEVNPPFVHSVLKQAASYMLELLAEAERLESDLTFVFITPGWGDASWFHDTTSPSNRFHSGHVTVRKSEHEYLDGAQWRADRLSWSANTSSFWIVLQSPVAARTRPLSDALRSGLVEVARTPSSVRSAADLLFR